MKSFKFLLIVAAMTLSSCWVSYFFTGFASGSKSIEKYYFEGYSKSELNKAVKRVFKKYPNYFVEPVDSLANFLEHYSFKAGSKDPYVRRLNADSVCFHFKLKINDSTNLLFWTRISGLAEAWEDKVGPYGQITELGIMGISDDFSSWRGYESSKKVTRKEKKLLKFFAKEFENEIISKIRNELLEKN